MKILSAAQTRALDQATITEQGITSAELMERAAQALLRWFHGRYGHGQQPADTLLLCGPGNNGGDGLALARLLHGAGYVVRVALLPTEKHSADWQHNRQRLPAAVPVADLDPAALPALAPGTVVVDALLGTGLSRPLAAAAAQVVRWLNAQPVRVLAVDLPSGLFADQPQPADSPVVRADDTVSFGLPKLAFLLPQNTDFVGEWSVEDIELSRPFIAEADTPWHLTQLPPTEAHPWTGTPPPAPDVALPRRGKFSYKNTFGHALLLAGSRGKAGAALLAAGAALRGGAGLLTVAVPACAETVLQTAAPEAMCLADRRRGHLSVLPDLAPYQAIGMGPGIGQHPDTLDLLRQLLAAPSVAAGTVPLVLDADALNLLGQHRELLALLPKNTVLTPHPGEFTRLTEPARDDYHRLELLREFAQQHKVIVVLKGAYTAVAAPDGQVYFNSTGNPGLATGGSGDVLTGLTLALRADKRLAPLHAARLAVLAHGHAADLAVRETGEAGMLAGDVVRHLGPALRELESKE